MPGPHELAAVHRADPRLRAEHLLADDARLFAHHLAHHSNPPHDELVGFAAAHGYEVAWDGLVVEV